MDDFYVMPRQENLSSCDTLVNFAQDNYSLTQLNPIETEQCYATLPTFAKNFSLESNLSFDDSQNVSLDSVPDLINNHTSIINDSYSKPQTTSVSLFFSVIQHKTYNKYALRKDSMS